MTIREGFFLFFALVGFAVGFVMIIKKIETDSHSKYLQDCLDRASCEIEEYKKILGLKKNKQRAFFDFEKANGKKEK